MTSAAAGASALPTLAALKASGRPIVMLTAYDFPSGRVAEEAGVDIVLVGDSAAMTVLGYDSTRAIAVDELLMLTRAVRRAVKSIPLVGDLPFGTYEHSDESAVATARRFINEAGCDAVKLEGAGAILERARAIVSAGIPVISVGNLAVGGTGKTPLVREVAGWMGQEGIRAAILSRGYARPEATPGTLRVSHAGKMEAMRWQLAGDEPWMLAKSLPGASVYVGRDRVESALNARADGAQALVLDDGFQHLRLARDFDIVCLRGDELGLRVLPAGPLREPASALSHADAVVHIRPGHGSPEDEERAAAEIHQWSGRIPARAVWVEAMLRASRLRLPDGSEESPGALRGRPVGILSGIARPRRFAELVSSLGGRVEAYHVREDHHVFDFHELDLLREDLMWVTTEKDAVRLPRDFPAAVLTVELQFGCGGDELRARVIGACRGSKAQ